MMAEKTLHLRTLKGHAQKAVCLLCKQPAVDPHTPFCSCRCAQLDLVKWLRGDYAIPAYEAADDSDAQMLLSAHKVKQAPQSEENS